MNRPTTSCPRIRFAFIALIAAAPASAQLRVANWNISNYNGGRQADLNVAIYGSFEGRTLAPDVFICQEFSNAAASTAFVTILNTAPGSPGDWAQAPFVNGPDTDSAFFYRTGKVDFLGMTVVAVGGGSPNHPRNIQRYDVRLVGYASAPAVLACYSSHMKAQDGGGDDDARRLLEAQRIRDDAEVLTPGWNFLLGGDFNIQNSASAEYQELVGSQPNNAGRFFDPINTPGGWNNSGSYRFVHTQDPSGAGGMDDRHDQILVSGSLVDGVAFDYIGNPALTYSTTTWDDPNHSYRAWGNDGTSFNLALTVTGNQMVGPGIAQALKNVATSAGHLPVVLNFRVPARAGSALLVDFGPVVQGTTAEQVLTVSNAANDALWTADGIDPLDYSLSTTAGFTAPAGPFVAAPAAPGNDHTIAMDTSTVGPMSGTLTITSDDPEEPARLVMLTGEVIPVPCLAADADCDLAVTPADVVPFMDLLLGTAVPCDACTGDLNLDGAVNGDDLQSFVAALVGP